MFVLKTESASLKEIHPNPSPDRVVISSVWGFIEELVWAIYHVFEAGQVAHTTATS